MKHVQGLFRSFAILAHVAHSFAFGLFGVTEICRKQQMPTRNFLNEFDDFSEILQCQLAFLAVLRFLGVHFQQKVNRFNLTLVEI